MKIPYLSKITNAKTHYRQLRKSDLSYILAECNRILEVISACEKGPPDLRSIALQLDQHNILLPKQSTGKRNSVKSFCSGIVDNFNTTQYDLSDKSCIGLTICFNEINNIFTNFDILEFYEVDELPKIPIPVTCSGLGSTFPDLFDLEVVVTFRNKQ